MTRRGFALGMAICVMAVVFLVGVAYSVRTDMHLFDTVRSMASVQAAYLAESGVRYGLSVPGPVQTTLTFDTGTVTVSVAGNVITTHAVTARDRRGLAVVRDGNGHILQWTETVP